MMQITSYHVHSVYSDGRNTVAEIVEAAVELGINEIGISDHFVYPIPGREVRWSMRREDLDSYFEELIRAEEAAGDAIKVRFGLECDFEPDTAEALGRLLEDYPLDYVIGSMHFLEDFPIDDRPEYWDNLSPEQRNAMMSRYWIRMADLARSRMFDFVGHIDLCKKFGYRPTIDLSREINAALEAIGESGMAVEVNTSGLYMPVGEAYPSQWILRACRELAIPVLITADAHRIADLTRGFDRARQIVVEAGYRQMAVFERRRIGLSAIVGA